MCLWNKKTSCFFELPCLLVFCIGRITFLESKTVKLLVAWACTREVLCDVGSPFLQYYIKWVHDAHLVGKVAGIMLSLRKVCVPMSPEQDGTRHFHDVDVRLDAITAYTGEFACYKHICHVHRNLASGTAFPATVKALHSGKY